MQAAGDLAIRLIAIVLPSLASRPLLGRAGIEAGMQHGSWNLRDEFVSQVHATDWLPRLTMYWLARPRICLLRRDVLLLVLRNTRYKVAGRTR